MKYRFRWHAQIRWICHGTASRPWRRTRVVRLKLSMPSEHFRIPQQRHASERYARRRADAGARAAREPAELSISGQALSDHRQSQLLERTVAGTLVNSVSILFLLLLGISASLLVNFILPLQKTARRHQAAAVRHRGAACRTRRPDRSDRRPPAQPDARREEAPAVGTPRATGRCFRSRASTCPASRSGWSASRGASRGSRPVGDLLQSVQRHSATMPSTRSGALQRRRLTARFSTVARRKKRHRGEGDRRHRMAQNGGVGRAQSGCRRFRRRSSTSLVQRICRTLRTEEFRPSTTNPRLGAGARSCLRPWRLISRRYRSRWTEPTSTAAHRLRPARRWRFKQGRAARRSTWSWWNIRRMTTSASGRLDQREQVARRRSSRGLTNRCRRARDVVDETARMCISTDLLAEVIRAKSGVLRCRS